MLLVVDSMLYFCHSQICVRKLFALYYFEDKLLQLPFSNYLKQ